MTSDKLRFLWWENGELSNALIKYRMCVYLFGSVCPPGYANLALKQTAVDSKDNFDQNTIDVINDCLYVDFNLADHASRGLSIKNFLKCTQSKAGPTFFMSPKSRWPEQQTFMLSCGRHTD